MYMKNVMYKIIMGCCIVAALVLVTAQSGCSRKRPELETVTPATAIPLSPPAARQSPGVQAQARPAGAL